MVAKKSVTTYIPSFGLDSEESLGLHVEALQALARPDNMLMIIVIIMVMMMTMTMVAMTTAVMMISSNDKLNNEF